MTVESPRSLVGFGLVLALGLIVTGSIVTRGFYKTKLLDNTVVVTGSAQEEIESDIARWTAVFNRSVGTEGLKDGSVLIKRDLDKVLEYLNKNGIKKDAVVINPVSVSANYESGAYGSTGRAIGYTLSQQIVVETSDVHKLTTLAQDSTALLSEGIVFTSFPLEYYYSKLDDLKIRMLGEATENARERAESIARQADADLGDLKAASMGVFQITSINSNEISDYGMFDTSAIKKRITAVVRTTFMVE